MFSVNPVNVGGVFLKLVFSTKSVSQNRVTFNLKKFIINNIINMKANAQITLTDGNSLVTNYNLSQGYPNPFNNTTQLKLDLPETGHVLAIIYNIKGQQIIKLMDENLPGGHHILKWNGRNESGLFVNSGIYLVKLVFNGKSGNDELSIRRIILMK